MGWAGDELATQAPSLRLQLRAVAVIQRVGRVRIGDLPAADHGCLDDIQVFVISGNKTSTFKPFAGST